MFPAVAARQKSGLAQADFARLLCVSVRTLQDWEQGRRNATRAARPLLVLASSAPKCLRKVLKDLAEAA